MNFNPHLCPSKKELPGVSRYKFVTTDNESGAYNEEIVCLPNARGTKDFTLLS